MILHTIRQQIDNDSLYFSCLREMLTNHQRSTWSSEDFMSSFSDLSGQELRPMISYYLDEALPPTLLFRSGDASGTKEYKWDSTMPKGFNVRISAMVGDQAIQFTPSNEWQQLIIPEGQELSMNTLDSGYFLVRQIE